MQVKQLIRDDDGVSPVIGVILMVAITVILAAVIASFVLGLGSQQTTAPTTSFAFDWSNASQEVTITHDSGENIKVDELYIRGDSDGGVTLGNKTWADLGGDASTDIGGTDAVASGDSLNLSAGSAYDLRVVWQPTDADQSSTLSEDTGPDA